MAKDPLGDACDCIHVQAVDWFPAPKFVNWYHRQHLDPPPPTLIAVSQDDDGFLWTLGWVADRRWRSSVRLATGTESEITDFDGYFDSIVERIDLRTNTVCASKRFDTFFPSFVAPGELWSYREDDEGIGRIDVFKLRINQ